MQKKRRLRRKGGGVYLFPLRSDSTELHPADLVLHAIEQKGPVNLRRVRRELNDERRGIPPRRFRLGIRADAANAFLDEVSVSPPLPRVRLSVETPRRFLCRETFCIFRYSLYPNG